jgi:branched-chain amino acid transport system permease protein
MAEEPNRNKIISGLGTLWGPVLGAFIFIPASDIILFRFGSSAIHLAILGGLMMLVILFLPRGILPSLQDWINTRRAPTLAHAGARSMAEMQSEPETHPVVDGGES